MALDELTISLNPDSDNLQYRVSMIQSVGGPQTKEALSIAPPGAAPRENILLGVSGMQADVTVRWMIHDDGTDKADGTATGVSGFGSDTVVTLNEQIVWLRDHIHDPSFSASWEISHTQGPRSSETVSLYDGDGVFIERVDTPDIVRESPKWLEARMALRRGQSIG